MITQDELKEEVEYDKNTGIFIWKKRAPKRKVGREAGGIADCGYRKITIRGIKYKAHRLAWLYVYGKFPDGEIDHINHNKIDNRIVNLRDVAKIENGRNISIQINNTSGFNGVYAISGSKKWHSSIRVNGALIYLGRFSNKEDAIKARNDANKKYGFHENHGLNICEEIE